MQRKPFRPFVIALLLITLAGLGYMGWKDGRNNETKSWTSPALPSTAAVPETPTPGWWDDLPSQPVIPTIPGRIVITASVTGTSSMKTFRPAKTMTDTHLADTPK
jgi:hypothetical protein